MTKPLNMGELSTLCDQYVTADFEGNYGFDPPEGFVAIVDAESELVCFVPHAKANLLERLINACEPAVEDGE